LPPSYCCARRHAFWLQPDALSLAWTPPGRLPAEDYLFSCPSAATFSGAALSACAASRLVYHRLLR
jgi:hypothetical protein